MTAAFFFGAQADDKKEGKDPRAEKFRAAEEEIWAAVKAGKLSKAGAQKHLSAIKKQIWADKGKEQKRGGKDPRAEKFRAAEEKIWGAVKAGKLSKEDAQKKLGAIKKQIWADKGKEQNRGGKDPRAEKFRAAEEKIWSAVKAGKLSKENAMKKFAGLKKEIWGGNLKKDSGYKKGSSDKDVETLRRQLEALKRENEGLRNRLKKR